MEALCIFFYKKTHIELGQKNKKSFLAILDEIYL